MTQLTSEEDAWTFALVTPDAVVGGYLGFVLERVQAPACLRWASCMTSMANAILRLCS